LGIGLSGYNHSDDAYSLEAGFIAAYRCLGDATASRHLLACIETGCHLGAATNWSSVAMFGKRPASVRAVESLSFISIAKGVIHAAA
jgi:hypothetical protein